ncbi:MAG: hypothetical protein SNJ75_07755 [Gemmataceae bacterium]
MLNLILAIGWLLGGVGIFVYEAYSGPLRLRLLGEVSIGWLMLVLSAWNWLRFYLTMSFASEREVALRVREAEERRKRRDRDKEANTGLKEYNPEFDFHRSAQPPGSPPGSPPNASPPSNS